ncbi:MAG: glucose 1-dehydrogenase [Deltaproteobacteria bacterium]|nr:MAG: glucose 1-dehydrogenase [Deltaproteobacteria bacterium]
MTILDKFSLDGKVAIVTGGGTGLGKAICHAFARAGADVVIAGRRIEPLNETATEVRNLGQRAMAISTDVTDSRQVEKLVGKTIAEFDKVDIMVNNAGIARGIEPSPRDDIPIKLGPIWELSDDKWRRATDLNLGGTFYCCRAVAEHMLKRKRGKVINMASVGGMRAQKGWFTYPAAKAGVIMLTKALAVTWARDNIQVNVIAPGFIKVVDASPGLKEPNPDFIPMGRFGEPKDVGLLAVFLASDASNYITGECFIIDGIGSAGYAPTGYAPVLNLNK